MRRAVYPRRASTNPASSPLNCPPDFLNSFPAGVAPVFSFFAAHPPGRDTQSCFSAFFQRTLLETVSSFGTCGVSRVLISRPLLFEFLPSRFRLQRTMGRLILVNRLFFSRSKTLLFSCPRLLPVLRMKRQSLHPAPPPFVPPYSKQLLFLRELGEIFFFLDVTLFLFVVPSSSLPQDYYREKTPLNFPVLLGKFSILALLSSFRLFLALEEVVFLRRNKSSPALRLMPARSLLLVFVIL